MSNVTTMVMATVVVMAVPAITTTGKGLHVIPHVMNRRLQALHGKPNVTDIAVRVANATAR